MCRCRSVCCCLQLPPDSPFCTRRHTVETLYFHRREAAERARAVPKLRHDAAASLHQLAPGQLPVRRRQTQQRRQGHRRQQGRHAKGCSAAERHADRQQRQWRFLRQGKWRCQWLPLQRQGRGRTAQGAPSIFMFCDPQIDCGLFCIECTLGLEARGMQRGLSSSFV